MILRFGTLVLLFLLTWNGEAIKIREVNENGQPKTATSSAIRLAALRVVMRDRRADAIIIPTADAHLSTRTSEADAHLPWLSDFSGTSGTVLVLEDSAGLWTDGRYTLQAQSELNFQLWDLYITNLATTPTMTEFLLDKFRQSGGKVIVNGQLYSHLNFEAMRVSLATANIVLESDLTAVLDARRDLNEDPPARKSNPIIPVSIDETGRSAMDKIAEVRQKIQEMGAHALVISALDSVAYLTNLRGSDIPMNPVFYSYIILTNDTITIFVQLSRLIETRNILSVDIPDDQLQGGLCKHRRIPGELFKSSLICSSVGCVKKKIWVPDHYSQALYEAAKGVDNVDIITDISPISLMKVSKTDKEAQGMVETHEKDGTAVVRLLHYLDELFKSGGNITEYMAARVVDGFRASETGFFTPSFTTISAAGPNAAVIHYRPTEGEDRVVTDDQIYLVDSGGQYTGGTTDVTRTVHYGTPTPEEILAYTLVLKGQIGVATSIIPYGSSGVALDTLARNALKEYGFDFAHNTGHGIGHRLHVHEGPIGIRMVPLPGDPGFGPNMFVSDEPGFYWEDHFGIRIEDVVQTVTARTPGSGTGPRQDIEGSDEVISDFDGLGALAFRKITLAPLALNLINMTMLDKSEIRHVDEYHERVNKVIGARLRSAGHHDAADWLAANTITLAAFNGALAAASNALFIVSVAVATIFFAR